ncbi:GNAT family N-acetyltransferase [Chitinophaga sp. Cy-1792]|uniref:GNAT family N-acetyltransferase n=1 Tax=Chitinophaga sp. Cy-1792 TaxID=2608339 RepID=UPI001422569C|nr:GNAT family N-acetyltransferase [Chitinophaga sp. Cy-1792]NIG54393.1 GNAT family N-acetyltransferase [Chitinophaga sp. Cy-1792]
MLPEIRIEKVYNDSSAAVIDIIIPIQTREFGVNVTLADQPDLQQIDSFYHGSGGGFWGIYVGDTLAGTIALINIGHEAGAIRKMFVKKEYRGKEYGLAQRLLEHLIAWCREMGIKDLYLGTVNILHAAIRFYERNQFQVIAKADLPSYFPLMSADNVFYHLAI